MLNIPPAAEYAANPPRRMGSAPSGMEPKEKNPLVTFQMDSPGTQPMRRMIHDPTMKATIAQEIFSRVFSTFLPHKRMKRTIAVRMIPQTMTLVLFAASGILLMRMAVHAVAEVMAQPGPIQTTHVMIQKGPQSQAPGLT